MSASDDPDFDIGENIAGVRKQGTKRQKYAARACRQCKRRKVKCSGDDACRQCQSRNVECRYSPDAPAQAQHVRAVNVACEYCPTATELLAGASRSSGAASFTDPRVDGLCDRVRLMERTLAHLLDSADAPQNPSSIDTTQTSMDLPDELCDEDDTNQFSAQPTTYGDLTLSSQVAAMSALLSKPPSPKPRSNKSESRIGISLDLPSPSSLQHLLDVYFREFDAYFPFLDVQDTRSRIDSVIHRLGHGSQNRLLILSLDDLSTVALLCHMLAMAECVDPGEGASDGETMSGWEQYIQGCRAMQRFSHSKTINLDVVRAQCLAAAYLMHNEILHAASRAVSVAWQLATCIRLHDQKAWPENAEEIPQRRRLWWTIYFLDRQISRRSGAAYHIRDIEFHVDDFSDIKDAVDQTAHAQPEAHQSISSSYVQVLVNLARLWGHVWDTFFAVGAPKKADCMEVEIMDARILNTRRHLPILLTWKSDDLAKYALNGEDEPHIRRRIQIYTRLTLLRMLIRQNPVRRAAFDGETAHLCSRLACEVIHAYDLFVLQFPEARATGYFTTSSIVECIYHLAPVMHHAKDTQEHAACVSAFNQAQGILLRLSVYNNVAKKALQALEGLNRKWGIGQSHDIDDVGYQSTATNYNHTQMSYPETSLINGLTVDSFGVDFAQWLDVGMGPLFDNELNVRLDG